MRGGRGKRRQKKIFSQHKPSGVGRECGKLRKREFLDSERKVQVIRCRLTLIHRDVLMGTVKFWEGAASRPFIGGENRRD